MSDVFANAFPASPPAADVPAETDVRSGIVYDSGGSTGSMVIPAESDVRLAVAYDVAPNAKTGDVRVPTDDKVEDGHFYDTLDSVEGTLFVPVPSYPLESQVLLGVGYGDAQNSFTGNYTGPATTDVQDGVTYGSLLSLEGTFEYPTESQVLETIGFGAGGVEFTGNVVLPEVTDVRIAIGYGPNGLTIGTMDPGGAPDYPSQGNVRDGVTYDTGNLTGTLQLPTESQVLITIGFGTAGTEFTGNVTLPATEDVEELVTYGPLLGITGSLIVLTPTYPLPSQVDNGIAYGDQQNSFTGTYVLVNKSNVRDGVFFGPNSSLEGELVALTPTYPAIDKVLLGINYGDQVDSFTGNYTGPTTNNVRDGVTYGSLLSLEGTVVLPDPTDVANGTDYGADGNEYTGSLLAGGYPGIDDVRDGIQFGASNEYMGNITFPTQDQVLVGIPYGSNSTEFLGELVPSAPVVDLGGYNPFG